MNTTPEQRIDELLAHLRRFENLSRGPDQDPIVAVAIAAIEEELCCLSRLAARRRGHATPLAAVASG